MQLPCPFSKKFPSAIKRDHLYFMTLAYNQAIEAWQAGEIPVGAVIVQGEDVIATGHNSVATLHDPTAHAEMIAITKAAAHIGDWRLNDLVLYVTKEPCPMCSGATIMARVGMVVYGVCDPKMGCLGGSCCLQNLEQSNHRPIVVPHVMETECLELLQTFFALRREQQKQARP